MAYEALQDVFSGVEFNEEQILFSDPGLKMLGFSAKALFPNLIQNSVTYFFCLFSVHDSRLIVKD